MPQRSAGNLAFLLLVLVNVILWIIFPPPNDGTFADYTGQIFSEVLASSAVILMAFSLFLATRPRWLEPLLGGLDKLYVAHKNAAISALLLLLLHTFLIPPGATEFSLGSPLGMLSLLGIIALVLLTIAPRMPLLGRFLSLSYTQWQRSHKLIGVFFIVGVAHFILVNKITAQTTVPRFYLLFFIIVGTGAFVYQVLMSRQRRRLHTYQVETVTKLNGTIQELVLKPQGQKLAHKAGQFAFVQFDGDNVLAEPHPFTISSGPDEDRLRLAIKASGDWTRHLRDQLEAGTTAHVDGPYGKFDYTTGKKEQIWIAGGIGVTPFLSWIRDFSKRSGEHTVDLYYTVRSPEEGLYLEEIEQAGANHPNLRVHINYSSSDGRLSLDEIIKTSGQPHGKDIYLCGALAMTETFYKGFRKIGVKPEQIHYEEFNFR
jgi:predicted ferric reductase